MGCVPPQLQHRRPSECLWDVGGSRGGAMGCVVPPPSSIGGVVGGGGSPLGVPHPNYGIKDPLNIYRTCWGGGTTEECGGVPVRS